MALQIGPPPTAVHPNAHKDAPPLAQENTRNNFVGYARDADVFLHELDNNVIEDDL